LLADFAANQLAGIVVVLDDVDVTALLRVALDNRELAPPEFLDGLRLAIKIVIMDLADQNPVRVFLDEIYPVLVSLASALGPVIRAMRVVPAMAFREIV
jgi:hypothetical protein